MSLDADDIVLLAKDNDTMMRLLGVAGEYGREFRVNFGADKSHLMVIEDQEGEERDRLMWGDLEIRRTQEYKCLGVTFNESGLRNAKQKETKALQWWGKLNSAAKRRANKNEVILETGGSPVRNVS